MAIPYATWANRGRGQMAVWLARTDAAAKPTPYPTIATTATLTNSQSTKNIRNIIDGEDPRASNDSTSYFDWWPRQRLSRAAAWRRRAGAPAARPLQSRENGSRWRSRSRRRSPRRRSTGSTTPAAAACACRRAGVSSTRMATSWKPVEAHGELRRREGRLQHRPLQAGHDLGAAHRARDAAQRLGRRAGVEGQVGQSANARRMINQVTPMAAPAPIAAPTAISLPPDD